MLCHIAYNGHCICSDRCCSYTSCSSSCRRRRQHSTFERHVLLVAFRKNTQRKAKKMAEKTLEKKHAYIHYLHTYAMYVHEKKLNTEFKATKIECLQARYNKSNLFSCPHTPTHSNIHTYISA